MNKKSKVASVLNIITSLIAGGVFGYVSYVLIVFLSIGIEQADTSAQRAELIVRGVALALPAVLSLVNFVMSIISFKYLGRGAERYSKGFNIAMFVVEFVAACSYVVFATMMFESIPLLIGSCVAGILFALFGFVHLSDFLKSKKAQIVSEPVQE
ncbi:MAG: hypothetical protein IJW24_02310 [Clostridia bacterium]|nr:hypothetical protein [Clostridia bacterium]